MSPFEVVHGYKPRKPTDLIPLPQHARVSITTESFSQHIKELHENIRNHINKSNKIYKRQRDAHRRHQEFQRDYVIVRTERLLPGHISKLEN